MVALSSHQPPQSVYMAVSVGQRQPGASFLGCCPPLFEIWSLASPELTKQARLTSVQVIATHQPQHWDFSNYNYSISPFPSPFLPPSLPMYPSLLSVKFMLSSLIVSAHIYVYTYS